MTRKVYSPVELTENDFISNCLPYWVERFFPEDGENFAFRETLVPLAQSAAKRNTWDESLEILSPQQKCQVWHDAISKVQNE